MEEFKLKETVEVYPLCNCGHHDHAHRGNYGALKYLFGRGPDYLECQYYTCPQYEYSGKAKVSRRVGGVSKSWEVEDVPE